MRAVAADAESGRPVQLFGAVRGRIILIALLGLVSAVIINNSNREEK